MNEKFFAKHAVLLGLAGFFVLMAGCTHTRETPVRDARPLMTARTQARPPVARAGEHVVQPKETLYAISRLYGASVQDLVAWNGLTGNRIEIGQVLKVSPDAGMPLVGAETVPIALPSDAPAGVYAPSPSAPANDIVDIKREPLGGREAYSDEAWARLQTPQQYVPSATISAPSAPDAGVPPPVALPSAEPSSAVPPPAVQPPVAPTPVVGGNWIWPVKGQIISRFDESTNAETKVRNRGIDIKAPKGTPVLAAANGAVAVIASNFAGYGLLVIVQHDDKYISAYGSNSKVLVKKGDTVRQGQKIGEVGTIGSDPTPKLHFELRKDGTPLDPLLYLPAQ
ncbi:MAG: M23 family metallopeptidase [Azoarcus sp.]|jgi:lipoprotein NlpD|nr:M23 family metallopeptidase [Azoarcus sp.]